MYLHRIYWWNLFVDFLIMKEISKCARELRVLRNLIWVWKNFLRELLIFDKALQLMIIGDSRTQSQLLRKFAFSYLQWYYLPLKIRERKRFSEIALCKTISNLMNWHNHLFLFFESCVVVTQLGIFNNNYPFWCQELEKLSSNLN